MTMMERPKFRRKRRPAADQADRNAEDDLRPVEPLETRAERLARRAAAREAEKTVADNAAAAAEAEERQQDHAATREQSLRAKQKARLEEEESRAAEAEAHRIAEDKARILAEETRRKDAQDRRRANAAREAEEKRKAEEARLAEEKRRADAGRLARDRRKAQAAAQKAQEKRRAEEQARADAAAEEARAEARRLEADALREAEAEARAAEEKARQRQAAIREAEGEIARRNAEEKRKLVARRAAEDAKSATERATGSLHAPVDDQTGAEAQKDARTPARAADAGPQADADDTSGQTDTREQRTRDQRRPADPPPPLALTHPVAPPAAPRAPQPRRKPVQLGSDSAWAALRTFDLDEAHLNRNRIVTATREDPAHTAFDVLRTRLLQALSENGWKRVAITSPGKDCGKTFTAANLAVSLSRQENCRTLLLDCDMRRPDLHKVMGVTAPGSMGDMLRGVVAPQDHLLRLGQNNLNAGRNIAFGFNSVVEPYASELLQDPRAIETLAGIEAQLEPDVVLFDLPPALFYDDVIAFRPHFDGVLLVIGGGITTQKEIKDVERRLGESTPLLGMVLNKAEGTALERYRY